MTDQTPVEVTNLDIYGSPALPWSRAHDILAGMPRPDATFFLGTVGPDEHPHAAGVGAIWFDGDLYWASSPESRKSRSLAANSACTFSVRLKGIDLILEGEAHRVTDQPTLAQVAKLFREDGWPVEVQGDAFTAPYNAPSAGKLPYSLYRFTFHTAFGVGTMDPSGATRWRFER